MDEKEERPLEDLRKTATFAREMESQKKTDQRDLDKEEAIEVKPTVSLLSEINFDTHGRKEVIPSVYPGAD